MVFVLLSCFDEAAQSLINRPTVMTSNIFRVSMLRLLQVSIIPMVQSNQDADAKHIIYAPAECRIIMIPIVT